MITKKKIILVGWFHEAREYAISNGFGMYEVILITHYYPDTQRLRGVTDIPYVLLPSFHEFDPMIQWHIASMLTTRGLKQLGVIDD